MRFDFELSDLQTIAMVLKRFFHPKGSGPPCLEDFGNLRSVSNQLFVTDSDSYYSAFLKQKSRPFSLGEEHEGIRHTIVKKN